METLKQINSFSVLRQIPCFRDLCIFFVIFLFRVLVEFRVSVIQVGGNKRKIYTLGTSTRGPEEFTSLLKFYAIDLVIDVRRFPTSKFEWFKKEKLKTLLDEADVQYLYMGKELGGYRSGGYEAYSKTKEFQKALGRLKAICRSHTAAIMCAERFAWKCHRRFIADELEKDGWEVVHIIDEKRVWKPKRR